MVYRVLCVVPSLPENLKTETIRSILNQTYPIEMLVFLPKKVNEPRIIARVTKVLNDGLSHLRLENFDYLLRIDGDTVIPRNFLEENIREQADCCGRTGNAMLIKVSTFLRLMGGRLNPLSDDAYLGLKFMAEGASVISWKVKASHQSIVHSGLDDYLYRGKVYYMLGYEPIHFVLVHLIHAQAMSLKDVVSVYAYFFAAVRRTKKLDVADYVWRYQVKRLFENFGQIKKMFGRA
jgi:hypothetical protein